MWGALRCEPIQLFPSSNLCCLTIEMGGRIIRASVVVLVSLIFRFFLNNIFNLRLSQGTELLQCIAHGCGAWIEAPVALPFPLSSPRSISQKKEHNGYEGAKNVQPPKEHEVYSGLHLFPHKIV
jgi:hypothetical protein